MKFTKFVNLLILVEAAFATNVIEATDASITEYLENGIPTMLDIYASWCSHCKRLSPVYDELSDLFDKDKVQFIKIDGDIHTKTAKKFDVEYFPTVKFLQNGEIEEVRVRDLEALAAYVTEKTGVTSKKDETPSEPEVPAKKSNVVNLLDTDFDQRIKGKNALVAFTANWCGHCKNLKPAYEELADVYVNDDLIIALVDSTGEGTAELVERFQVSAFPTILFFPASGEDPERYNQRGRGVQDFVDYFTKKKVSFRTVEGGLSSGAGRIEALDKLAANVFTATDVAEAVNHLKKEAEETLEGSGKTYIRVADNIVKNGVGYVQKEIDRLSGIISKKSVGQQKLDELQTKLNILEAFIPTEESETDNTEGIVHEDL
jgi:protein disulfide-isomerase A6